MLSKKSLIAAVVIVVLILIAGCIYNGYQDQVYRETKLSTTLDHEWGSQPTGRVHLMNSGSYGTEAFARFTIGDNVRFSSTALYAYNQDNNGQVRLVYIAVPASAVGSYTISSFWDGMRAEYGKPNTTIVKGDVILYYRLNETVVANAQGDLFIFSINEIAKNNPKFVDKFSKKVIIKGGK